jgi:hypothetical protein
MRQQEMNTTIPGSSAAHCVITEMCRENRGQTGAFDEAAYRLREQYEAIAAGWPIGKGATIHLLLTIERPESRPRQTAD